MCTCPVQKETHTICIRIWPCIYSCKTSISFFVCKIIGCTCVHVLYSYTGSSPDSVRCSGRDQPSQGHPKKNLGILQLKLAPCVVRVWRWWWTSTGRRMPWEDARSKTRRCVATFHFALFSLLAQQLCIILSFRVTFPEGDMGQDPGDEIFAAENIFHF